MTTTMGNGDAAIAGDREIDQLLAALRIPENWFWRLTIFSAERIAPEKPNRRERDSPSFARRVEVIADQ